MSNSQAKAARYEADASAGLFEQFSTMRGHLGIYLSVGLTASYTRVAAEPLKAAIFRALACVISQYPSLSAVPVDVHTSHPYFVRITRIYLERTVTFVDADETVSGDLDPTVDKILEAQHNLPFVLEKEPLPFWRLVVVSPTTDTTRFVVAFIFHHCLGDGQSGVAFHRCLAKALCQRPETEPKSIIESPKIPMLPTLDNLHKGSSSDAHVTSTGNASKPSPSSGNIWAGGTPSLPVETRFQSIYFSNEMGNSLVTQCRANGTSVTATMQTLIAVSLFSILPETFTAMNSDCPISLRRWLDEPITDDSIGCFVGAFSQTHIRQGFSWDEARRCRRKIDEIMAGKGQGMPFSDPKGMAANLKSWLESKIEKPRMCAFEVSNLGHLKENNGLDLYKLDSFLFSQSAGATGPAITASLATGPDGRLTIGFSWQQGIVSEEVISHLLQDLPKRLETLAYSNDTS